MHVKEIYAIFIHLFDSGILLIIDLNKKKKGGIWLVNFTVKEIYNIGLLSIPVGVSPLQLVNLHRNQRYFVIKLHTWFSLSYFLKTNRVEVGKHPQVLI
jgi:hypothetical protein